MGNLVRGPIVDSVFTHQRAKKAGAARHSARTYARSIVKNWPALTEDQRAEVAQITAPIVAELAALAEKAGQ